MVAFTTGRWPVCLGWSSVRAAIGVAAALLLLGSAASAAVDGEQRLRERCHGCHGAEAYETKRHTALAWRLVVWRMQLLHGAQLGEGDPRLIVKQLVTSGPPPTWRIVVDWGLLAALPTVMIAWCWRRRFLRRVPRRPVGSGAPEHHNTSSR